MRLNTLCLLGLFVLAPTFAQTVQRSSHAQGVQIRGDAEIISDQKTVTSAAVGESNTVKNVAGAIKGEVQIKGNVQITATQKNATSVSTGKNNEAGNQAGVIGGK